MEQNKFTTIKYESSLVTFTEIPDEISLCFNISGCPCLCEGCFEPWLKDDIGETLTSAVLEAQLARYKYITCICFMGGDRYYADIAKLVKEIKQTHPRIKIAMYSGRQEMNESLSQLLDYYKVGPYIEKFGPLNKPTTNQCLYKKINGE